MIPGEGDHIPIPKRSCARGHQDGAVRYFEGVHLSKKSPPEEGGVLLYSFRPSPTPSSTNSSAHDAAEGSDDPLRAGKAMKILVDRVAVPGSRAVSCFSTHRDRQVQRFRRGEFARGRVVAARSLALANGSDAPSLPPQGS